MRKTVVVVLVAIALASASPGAQDAEKLFKAAMNTELVEGNLRSAIEQYRKVVESGPRPLAAQALLRMAESYQKLGDAEARKTYERLVRDYADQSEAVAIARTRLGGATPAGRTSEGISTRRVVDIGAESEPDSVSDDGRLLSYIDWSTGNVALVELATRTTRPLTNTGGWAQSDEFAEESVLSPDGQQIAYSWSNTAQRYELRVLSLEGKAQKPARILYTNKDVEWIAPADWSRDGQWIAVQLIRSDRSGQIGLVRVADGTLRVLKTAAWRNPSTLSFSPDGRHLAFDLPADDTSDQRDIFILAIDGSRETPAVVGSSNDTVIGWSPDGRMLLFASDRRGSVDLWGVHVSDGRIQGSAEVLKADISRGSLGITASGRLYLGVEVGDRDIRVTPVDFATGKLRGPTVRPVQRFVGNNVQPEWSPDGKSLAYVSLRDRAGFSRVLAIQALEDGKVRELQPKLSYFDSPRWSPDGRSVVMRGRDLQNRHGVFTVDIENGEVTPFVVSHDEPLVAPQWSPDGKKVIYRRGSVVTAFIERDVATGTEREILRQPGLGNASVSPDGRTIASTRTDPSTRSTLVFTIPTSGGQPKEILRVNAPQSILPWVNWTPDGTAVVVATMAAGKPREMWVYPVNAAGEPSKLEIPDSDGWMKVHPDGIRIAYQAGKRKLEVWAVDDFLPVPARGAN
jgi:Tol biopolymer transport system component